MIIKYICKACGRNKFQLPTPHICGKNYRKHYKRKDFPNGEWEVAKIYHDNLIIEDIRKMKKLRLLVTENCNRNCPGCCNKDWDLDSLEICTSFKGYDEVILTGGEPMLYPRKLLDIIYEIRKQNSYCKIYIYCNYYTTHN